MPKKNYFVVSNPQGGWSVKSGGSQRASANTSTQKEAIEIGKRLATNNSSELTIQGKNGQFREKNSYGNDPHPPKG
ncbi:uncharacterized protein DUF2188 [Roseivirga ehrenbergii]|uniref:DUF2188 domain-containing protein n=1 Tax=Roseivirga ehrenbergii (strain DSM 102268 / JCM 13514 / KCTC 12282 / NCIMB 14502 / KMM 6017) TaxID=279360 RepID=A0A150X863_ROSEK|nr:DUF2188 domain-containing protein [Roseivirga ehrenbergii]KYG74852.1 hypothetical protein MB14_06515 [Roseivirga ehrenbergii]TCL13812.1 uncharacterized protein DUF2188 [Roseivirga ehrenbergii]